MNSKTPNENGVILCDESDEDCQDETTTVKQYNLAQPDESSYKQSLKSIFTEMESTVFANVVNTTGSTSPTASWTINHPEHVDLNSSNEKADINYTTDDQGELVGSDEFYQHVNQELLAVEEGARTLRQRFNHLWRLIPRCERGAFMNFSTKVFSVIKWLWDKLVYMFERVCYWGARGWQYVRDLFSKTWNDINSLLGITNFKLQIKNMRTNDNPDYSSSSVSDQEDNEVDNHDDTWLYYSNLLIVSTLNTCSVNDWLMDQERFARTSRYVFNALWTVASESGRGLIMTCCDMVISWFNRLVHRLVGSMERKL
ncbi:unnamed protein product [Medioppia subpectinata]|uniref:Uncharacterized protein n=1 Tax=Medioppia subpectinata TaxID=1979941 RepID=A0A7R9L667_9ACAR|nr:unnamed protein product [Medioppia subpectinata]CAG2116128.1 unnamed protein product [Medioppia subpectinata]